MTYLKALLVHIGLAESGQRHSSVQTHTKIIGEWDLHQFIGYFLIPLDPCSKFIFCRKRGHKVRQVPLCHAGDRQEVAQGQAGVRGGVQRLPGLHHKVQGGQHVKENCSSKNRHF